MSPLDHVSLTKLIQRIKLLVVSSDTYRFFSNLILEAKLLSDEEIESAKHRTAYRNDGPHHEHSDCIRIAYQWLDAQKKTKGLTKRAYPLKHIIEQWAGRYVSTSDVEVAATLHPEIRGTYPHFNISSRLTRPSKSRLDGIAEAFTQNYTDRHANLYSSDE